MKKVLIGIATVFVLVVAAVVIVPFLIPAETYVARIQEAVKESTGRDLTIAGDVSVSVFPNLTIEANDVSFSNPDFAKNASMASLKSLQASLQVMPLFSGEVKVDRFILVEPVINVEKAADGRMNLEMEPQAGAAEAEAETSPASPAPDAASEPGGPADLPAVSLGEVRIENGTLTYTDHGTGQNEKVTGINADVTLESLQKPAGIDGTITWHGEEIALTLNTGAPADILGGKQTSVTAAIESNPVTLSYDGHLTMGDILAAAGALDLDVPSVRGLAAWAGNPLPADAGGSGLGPLAIKGKLEMKGDRISFDNADLSLDAIRAKGAFAFDGGGAKPAITARLDVETLDLNPYLGGGSAGAGEGDGNAESSGSGQASSGGAAPQGWSDAPIDTAALGLVEADLNLSCQGIRYQDIKIGSSTLEVTLHSSKLVATLKELNLYEGVAKGRLVLDGASKPLKLEKEFNLDGLQARPLLSDAAGFDRLEGTAAGHIAITSRGNSQKALMSNLNGKGDLTFLDGAIIGVNIAAMVRNVTAAFTGEIEEQKTDFAELSGTFTIKNGLLRNDDLKLVAPLLRMGGQGTVNIAAKTMDYRVEPKAVPTLEGQGGEEAMGGVLVPVNIKGPWHDLSYEPDLAAMLTPEALMGLSENLGNIKVDEEAAKAVEDVTKALESGDIPKQLEEEAGKELMKVLGGGGKTGDGQQQGGSGTPNPEDMLRGMLGGSGSQDDSAKPAEKKPTESSQPAVPEPEKMLKGLFGQ